MTISLTQAAYRPNDVAELLGVKRTTIFNLIRDGELSSFKIGHARVITAESILAFLARKIEESAA